MLWDLQSAYPVVWWLLCYKICTVLNFPLKCTFENGPKFITKLSLSLQNKLFQLEKSYWSGLISTADLNWINISLISFNEMLHLPKKSTTNHIHILSYKMKILIVLVLDFILLSESEIHDVVEKEMCSFSFHCFIV